jgi:DNA-binding LacI/PurR family transcriptional regulator
VLSGRLKSGRTGLSFMASLKEVAKLCGVTPATVSYIMNGRHLDRMLPETIQKVRAAAEKLNYRPHASARSLVTGRSETLGVYCPGHLDDVWGDGYLVDVLRGIFYESAVHHYAVQVATDDLLEKGRYQRQPAVDGWISVMARTAVPPFIKDSGGVLYLDPFKRIAGGTCVWGDNTEAGRVAGEFCRRNGWKTAFVLLEPLKDSPQAYQERLQGVRAAFEGRKKLLRSEPFVLTAREDGSVAKLKSLPVYAAILSGEVEALICTSDLLPCRILRDSRKLGFGVPDAVRLVGIDNLLQSRLISPAITTVDIGALELGRQAAQHILNHLQKKSGEFRPPKPKLLERETT